MSLRHDHSGYSFTFHEKQVIAFSILVVWCNSPPLLHGLEIEQSACVGFCGCRNTISWVPLQQLVSSCCVSELLPRSFQRKREHDYAKNALDAEQRHLGP